MDVVNRSSGFLQATLGALAALAVTSCSPGGSMHAPDGGTPGGFVQVNTFDHHLGERDPIDILAQKREEGPAPVSTRLHSCRKLSYAALGNLLVSRGVDLGAHSQQGQPPTAGELYRVSAAALAGPNYGARKREATQWSVGSAARMMDIFLLAAPEIIQAMPSLAACRVGGRPVKMFDDSGDCARDGVSCLLGASATPDHVSLCNQLIGQASSRDIGQRIAVAALLSAAHTCD
jgi:hypothetical protein